MNLGRFEKRFAERRLAEGERAPFWWGRSYYDPLTNEVICHPIPLNWIVALVRDLYWRVSKGYRAVWERQLSKALSDEYRRGLATGEKSGIQKVFAELDRQQRLREEAARTTIKAAK